MTGQLYAVLPPDEHPPYARPCRGCGGTGLTGEQYEFNGAAGTGRPILLVDVICPACTGCGNGDPEHEDCAVNAHAYPDENGPGYDDTPDDSGCYSCGTGRGWNAVQAWPDDDPDSMVVLRVACGCSETRLVTLPGADGAGPG